ncbi:MAG: hypothetical protein NC935_02210 [Candidatus Omnitrophica bacterium]|nr:hypothetical protein [Candidatus Omnitrophota bacterium]
MLLKKAFNKLEDFIFGVGAIKMVKKELFSSILTLLAAVFFFITSLISFSLNKNLYAFLYLAIVFTLFLSFLSHASKYRLYKNLAIINKSLNNNEIKSKFFDYP